LFGLPLLIQVARVDAFAPGVSLDLDPESSGKGGGKYQKAKVSQGKGFWLSLCC